MWPGVDAARDGELSSQLPWSVAVPSLGRTPTAPFRRESSSKAKLRLTLELAYPLAGDAEFGTQLGEGRRLSAVQSVPAYQDASLTIRHLLQ